MPPTSYDIFVILDSDGNYSVGTDIDEATTSFTDNIGGEGARSVYRITFIAPRPAEIAEVECAAPDVPQEAVTASVEAAE
jgi:hypothetical protein